MPPHTAASVATPSQVAAPQAPHASAWSAPPEEPLAPYDRSLLSLFERAIGARR